MEDSEKRKERLQAMRAIAAQDETFSSSTNAHTRTMPPFLDNPLLETPVDTHARDRSQATQRFDFYTDPMAAFSANKKRSNVAGNLVSQDYSASHGNFGSPMPRFSTVHQGQRYPQMNSSHGHLIPSTYVPPQGVYPPQSQGPYHGATPFRSPRGIANPYSLNQGPPPGGLNMPGDLYSSHGSAYHRGMSSPYPVHQGSTGFNRGRGYGGRNPGFSRGGGRGRGFHLRNSGPGPEFRNDNSVIKDPWQVLTEDPWKDLKPVLWRGPDASTRNKTINTKKSRISESATPSHSKQSLAEYLATSFNEASKDS